MENNALETRFAPAERSDKETVLQQSGILTGKPFLLDALNAVSIAIVVLNNNRQIVFGNKAFLSILDNAGQEDITGLRVGEALGCIHAFESDGGCGTTEFCSLCGAVNAMLSAIKGDVDVKECRITEKMDQKAYDLRVMAAPFSINGAKFTMFSVIDIANEKRKEILERIFIHDLLNTAGGLQGFSRLLTTATEDDLDQYTKIINNLADELMDEIESQRQLMQAENNRLKIHVSSLRSLNILKKVKETYMKHNVAEGRSISIDPDALEYTFSSDEALLLRVVGNMTKNALEAIRPGNTVNLNCTKENEMIRFSVQNPGEMPKEAQLQVFQRSYSTKGSGRGLGTYSIKLLTEQYLEGKVGFSTSPEGGTLFYADYPEELKLE